ncbi:MAG: hypothetical protein A2100_04705 [Sideroxydans sp. GWF2_59_14]|nr:MAG: hypothetical protein A2100_04705 [Sideroxydans sp. GWF2_59_14]HAF45375.1 hypothetical protein [Gallionellaceae bacterium]
MGSINKFRNSSYLLKVPVIKAGESHCADIGEQKTSSQVKPSSEEVYITSCRPTRLSMELIAQIRAKDHE